MHKSKFRLSLLQGTSPNILPLPFPKLKGALDSSLLLENLQPGPGEEWEPGEQQAEARARTAWVLKTVLLYGFSINKNAPAHSSRVLLGPNLYTTENHIPTSTWFITLLFMAGEGIFFFFGLKTIFITGETDSRLHTSSKTGTGALP